MSIGMERVNPITVALAVSIGKKFANVPCCSEELAIEYGNLLFAKLLESNDFFKVLELGSDIDLKKFCSKYFDKGRYQNNKNSYLYRFIDNVDEEKFFKTFIQRLPEEYISVITSYELLAKLLGEKRAKKEICSNEILSCITEIREETEYKSPGSR